MLRRAGGSRRGGRRRRGGTRRCLLIDSRERISVLDPPQIGFAHLSWIFVGITSAAFEFSSPDDGKCQKNKFSDRELCISFKALVCSSNLRTMLLPRLYSFCCCQCCYSLVYLLVFLHRQKKSQIQKVETVDSNASPGLSQVKSGFLNSKMSSLHLEVVWMM